MAEHVKPLVYVIGTGGSIACIGDSSTDFINYNYADKHYMIEEMLARLPEVNEFATVRTEQFLNVYGGEVSPAHWVVLARRVNAIFREDPEAAGVAITHGTACLEETAYFLNLTVKSRKPVVVTGAMRPMTALSNDATLNLLDCVRVAANPAAVERGALIVLNNQIQAAREGTKSSTSRLDAFKSADLGFLGYADSDGEVVFYRSPTKTHTHQTEFDVNTIEALPRVDIALVYSGADGSIIPGLLQLGCKGLIVAGLGSGSAPRAFHDALSKAVEKGVAVVMASQTGSGRVMARRNLTERGYIVADNLQPKKARILLMLALTRTHHTREIQQIFRKY